MVAVPVYILMLNFKSWLAEAVVVGGVEFRTPLPALRHLLETHPSPENLVVTYTAVDKVGVNPRSNYNTPIGIYFYPLKYVVGVKMNVPFAGNMPFINVCEFTRPGRILHMRPGKTQRGMDRLSYLPKGILDRAKGTNWRGYELRSDHSKLWLTAMVLAYGVRVDGFSSLNTESVMWNRYLRDAGIDGFVDHGTGTIHTSEPTQGVVFSADALRRLYVIENPRAGGVVSYMGGKPGAKARPGAEGGRRPAKLDRMTVPQLVNLIRHSSGGTLLKYDDNEYDFTGKIMAAASKGDLPVGPREACDLIIANKPEITDEDVWAMMRHADPTGKRSYGKEEIGEMLVRGRRDLGFPALRAAAMGADSEDGDTERVLEAIFSVRRDLSWKEIEGLLLVDVKHKDRRSGGTFHYPLIGRWGDVTTDGLRRPEHRGRAFGVLRAILENQQAVREPEALAKLMSICNENLSVGWERLFFPIIDEIGYRTLKGELRRLSGVVGRHGAWGRDRRGRKIWLPRVEPSTSRQDLIGADKGLRRALEAYEAAHGDEETAEVDGGGKLDKAAFVAQGLPRLRGPKPIFRN